MPFNADCSNCWLFQGLLCGFFHLWGFPHHFCWFCLSSGTTRATLSADASSWVWTLHLELPSVTREMLLAGPTVFRPPHPFSRADWGFVPAGYACDAHHTTIDWIATYRGSPLSFPVKCPTKFRFNSNLTAWQRVLDRTDRLG